MSIFSKFLSAIRGGGEPKPAVAPARAVEQAYAIPTVKFDTQRVTEAIKDDLKINIKEIKDFNESNFGQIYDATLLSINRGGDLSVLFKAIMALNLPSMTKQRAGEISSFLNSRSTAMISRDQQVRLGIKYATWMYSGAPCYMNHKKPTAQDIRRNAAHKAAGGKRYEVAKGMLLNGKHTWPGREEGCKCVSRSNVEGFS